MNLIEKILKEAEIKNTMNFYHGGNLDIYDDSIAQKNGRYEWGAGLYLTNYYDTAKKYAKGSRKLYIVQVAAGNEINDCFLNYNNVQVFIKNYVIGNRQKEVISYMQKHIKDDKLDASIFNNIILNSKSIKATNTKNLRNFLVTNNIDYELVNNPFGFGKETMMVLYNMKKIINYKIVNPKEEIIDFIK